MDAHGFRHLQGTIRDLNPRQIEELWAMLGRVRAEKEALAEIKGRTGRDALYPHCKQHRERPKWGRTRTSVQRFRCGHCRKTYSGLTGTAICGLHRPGLFLEVTRDMMSEVPSSCRKLAERVGINPETVRRWRIRILAMLSEALHLALSGIVEVDETYQRESRKGLGNGSGTGEIRRAGPHLPAPDGETSVQPA